MWRLGQERSGNPNRSKKHCVNSCSPHRPRSFVPLSDRPTPLTAFSQPGQMDTMAEKSDYYEVLVVSRTASADEIKRAYRTLARKYHPDINAEDHAEERFKEINEAHEVLSDSDRRANYDRFGHAATNGMGGGDPFVGFGGSPFGDLF